MKPAGPVDISGWRTLDDDARRLIVERLRPHMRAIAEGLGAQTRAERCDILEALGCASLAEAGWAMLVARGHNAPPLEI